MKLYLITGILLLSALAVVPSASAAQCASATSCAYDVRDHCGGGALLSQSCSNAISNLPEGAQYQAHNTAQNLACVVQEILSPGSVCLVPEPCRPGQACETIRVGL